MNKKILVTVDEAVKVARKQGNVSTVDFSGEVYRSYLEMCESDLLLKENDNLMKEMFALAAVFEAGRIQGIREERQRKAKIKQPSEQFSKN